MSEATTMTATECWKCDAPMRADPEDRYPECADCLAECYWCGSHCGARCEQSLEAAVERAELVVLRAQAPRERCHGQWHWRRWRLTGWLFARLYVLGVTSNGGGSGTKCGNWLSIRNDCPGHPGWGWVHHGPGWRSLVRRRVYVLGIRTEWLAQLPYCLRNGHWPLWLESMGCGKCAPWPCCGAIGYDHAAGCVEG